MRHIRRSTSAGQVLVGREETQHSVFKFRPRRAKRAGYIFLAGGLTPANIGKAIRAARPYAVDVCSGVEAKPRKKDPVAVKDFMRAVREAHKTI